MAITAAGSFPQKPKNWKVQILPADTTTLKTLVTGSADGSKITAVIATSSDTAARDITIGITRSGTFFPLGTITIPITAGQIAATPAMNILDISKIPGLPFDSDGNPYIFLADGTDLLQVKALITVTAAKELDFIAVGSDWS